MPFVIIIIYLFVLIIWKELTEFILNNLATCVIPVEDPMAWNMAVYVWKKSELISIT